MENAKLNRRKHPRLHAYHLVKYKLLSSPENKFVTASVKNISGGGVCLRSVEKLPVSSVLEIYISFPQLSEPIPGVVKVVWVKKLKKEPLYESGIQFLNIEEALRDVIIKRVDYVYKRANGILKE